MGEQHQTGPLESPNYLGPAGSRIPTVRFSGGASDSVRKDSQVSPQECKARKDGAGERAQQECGLSW